VVRFILSTWTTNTTGSNCVLPSNAGHTLIDMIEFSHFFLSRLFLYCLKANSKYVGPPYCWAMAVSMLLPGESRRVFRQIRQMYGQTPDLHYTFCQYNNTCTVWLSISVAVSYARLSPVTC